MTQPPDMLPRKPDVVEIEFLENLRAAAYVCETEEYGRFKGSIRACAAVVNFIKRRDQGAELAAPFAHIAEAFNELERGNRPRLFTKKTTPEKERERSPERKHYQKLAATALEVLVNLGDDLRLAADKVARHVNKWPGMAPQEVTGNTVTAWRRQLRRSSGEERSRFEAFVRASMAEPDPRKTIEDLLRNGPRGSWKK